MTHGPIDFLIVGFNGSKFDSSVLKALEDAADKGVIKVLALSAIVKNPEGMVTRMDFVDMGDEAMISFSQKYATNNDLIDQADIDEVAELMENDTAAGLLIVEHLWAIPLKEALLAKNAYLIADGRIHPDAAAELE